MPKLVRSWIIHEQKVLARNRARTTEQSKYISGALSPGEVAISDRSVSRSKQWTVQSAYTRTGTTLNIMSSMLYMYIVYVCVCVGLMIRKVTVIVYW